MRPRELVWEGCINVRDLGGLPLDGGGTTRFDVIVRADNVRGLTDDGWRSLAGYGVRRIVDLRWQFELDEDPPREVDLEVVHVPVLDTLDRIQPVDELTGAIDDPVEWRAVTYLELLRRFQPRFGEAVAAVVGADGTVLVHCMGGVDRTGLVSALVLRVAGVRAEHVAADFGLSGANWAPRMPAWIADASDDTERRRRRLLGDIRAEAMAAVLGEVDAEAYLREAGVSDEALERLRARLVG